MDYIQKFVRVGDTIYLAVAHGVESQHDGRLVVLDCANVQTLQQVGVIPLNDVCYGMVAAGACVGVTSPRGVISLYDVSDAVHPTCAAVLDLPGYSCRAAEGTTMAIAGSSTIVLMDVSDPWRPTVVHAGTAPAPIGGVVLRGELAYVTCGELTAQVMDFSDATNPPVVTPIGDVMPVWRIGGAGNGLWVTGGFNFGTVYFLESGTAPPSRICATFGEFGSRRLDAKGSRACIVNGSALLSVLDASNPRAPVARGTIQLPGAPRNLVVSEDVSLVVIGNTLYAVDTREPAAPVLADSVYVPRGIIDIAAAPGVAAIVDGGDEVYHIGGVTLLDTSNPDSLRNIGRVQAVGWMPSAAIAIAGSRLYVAWGGYAGWDYGYFDGYDIIDIALPSQPNLVSRGLWACSTSSIIDMMAAGGILFVNVGGQVQLCDIENPDGLRFAGALPTRGYVSAMTLSGSTLYAAEYENGYLAEVFDMVDVMHPEALGNVLLSNRANGAAVIGEYLWLGEETALEVACTQCQTNVPVVLRRLVSMRGAASVTIEWNVDEADGRSTYRLEGRAHGGTWLVPFEACGRGAYCAEDRTPGALGGDPSYVLFRRESDGGWTPLGETQPQNRVAGDRLCLYPVAPNPFNPRTTIRFDLPGTGPVKLAVYDIAGRLVKVLVEGARPAGRHEEVWDGRDTAGRPAPSGSYLVRLVAGGKVEAVRMGLVR